MQKLRVVKNRYNNQIQFFVYVLTLFLAGQLRFYFSINLAVGLAISRIVSTIKKFAIHLLR